MRQAYPGTEDEQDSYKTKSLWINPLPQTQVERPPEPTGWPVNDVNERT